MGLSVPSTVQLASSAAGTFDVDLKPAGPEDRTEGSVLGRMSFDKRYHGDLEAVARGQMLTAVTSVDGSAGYVAIERVEGALHGRRGAFVLQHSGTVSRGSQQLSISVVPDSATGELAGLSGAMTISIADGVHSYELEYRLRQSR
jgi:hypothetical protein